MLGILVIVSVNVNLKDFDASLLKVDKKITKRLTFITSTL